MNAALVVAYRHHFKFAYLSYLHQTKFIGHGLLTTVQANRINDCLSSARAALFDLSMDNKGLTSAFDYSTFEVNLSTRCR